MIRPDLSLPIPETITSAHFIGVGGSGMSGLARMFLDRGIRVSGSDRSDSAALQAQYGVSTIPADAATTSASGLDPHVSPQNALSQAARIAADNARIGFVFGRRGLVPEAGSAWFLPRLVGVARALRWCLEGELVGAQEALAAFVQKRPPTFHGR